MERSGWVRVGVASFGLTGGACDFVFDGDHAFVQSNHNLVEIMSMSDTRHVKVTIVSHDEMPPVDDNPKWEAAGEVSVTFDNPPRIGRIGHEAGLRRQVSDSLLDLQVPAGTYRLRCYVTGANAASDRRVLGREDEEPPASGASLMERFQIDLAPQESETPPRTIKMRHPEAGY